MGVLKHLFGDDMTPEEKARLDHAELVETARSHGNCLTSRALWKHHDRVHGVAKLCAFCNEPALDRVAEIFERPSIEPMRASGDSRPIDDRASAIFSKAFRDAGFDVGSGVIIRRGTFDANGNFKLDPPTEKHDNNV